MLPDWRIADHYAALARAERKTLAWEWLRRTNAYNHRWIEFRDGHGDHRAAREFGLETFEDPALPTPDARPVWRAEIDGSVVIAEVRAGSADALDEIDLLEWRPFVSIVIDVNQDEHILLWDGARSLRIDIIGGTLIGCPALPVYRVEGLSKARLRARALDELITLKTTGRFGKLAPSSRILSRWILELRAADALRANASQHEIAQHFFGASVPERNWRSASASFRLRTQRLVRQARKRLDRPLDRKWFGCSP
ncbi:DNA -binding domain-containing protein [Sphingomonas oryzagri]